ncbi:ABC transporter ATP-binding protein [Hoeflea poritis]|uniref:ABC transporter ATP-binding protein n=1 Tax=Hoeflea poritis TaxID=2993659 RepID=A0ABT4VLW1_9HYPH|nr:ABC transporter ATP-binding protein [Hoeflea poritis]MDA4845033.1 ABC transporter ATP-binding protein [Hoeflea poritis]
MTAFLEIENLSAAIKGTPDRLLRSVSLHVNSGEVCGLVGESGAGKSMIGKAVLGILPSAVEIVEGQVRLDGEDLLAMPQRERRRLIGATAALIPQDPLTALNPSRRIGPQITDRLVDILGWTKHDARTRAAELLDEVHIENPQRVLASYPHELSGGMRQRVLIASAFAANPKLVIADEPTTALDVTVQKQILRLIREMQERHGTAMLFVTHDLGVVSKICQRLVVLFAGMVVEKAGVSDFYANPAHAYSKALLSATPKFTEPFTSLTPVDQTVISAVSEQVEAADREWRHAH